MESKAGVDGVDMERIEVLMATYNGKSYIREQIDSILNQTYENWHLTISDDGSTDGTDLIIDEYVKEYPDKISRAYSGMRFGNARDHFFWMSEKCASEYILYSDQDDVFAPDKMRRLMDAMQNAEEKWSDGMPILVFSDQKVVDEKLNIIAPSLMRYQKQAFDHFDYRAILMQNVVTGGAMMMNRSLCDLALQCRSREQTIMHDWWIALCAAAFGRVAFLPRATIRYRQHGGNSVGAKNVRNPIYVLHRIKGGGIRLTMNETMRQAGAFADCFEKELSPQDLSLCRDYAACETRGRFSRAAAFLRLKTFKHGLPQKVIQLLLG